MPQGDAGQMEAAQMDLGQMDSGQMDAGQVEAESPETGDFSPKSALFPQISRAFSTVSCLKARQIDFLPAVNGGDSFYAAHGDASAIGWVCASQPAATKAVDLCAAARPF